MAKKKKSKKSSKKVAPEPMERSAFWPLAGAIGLYLIAFFLLLGGFGTGGPLPVNLFDGAYAVFGWGAYLTPFALAFWATYKFMTEDRRIPLGKFFSMLFFLAFAAGWLYVAFASKDPAGNWSAGHGGAVGSTVGGMVLSALDKVPASILFFIAGLLSLFFALGVSPKEIIRLFELFKQPKDEDEVTDLATLKARAAGFKLNEGVPVEHHEGDAPKEPVRLGSLKNTAQKLTANENHEALTTASDPDWQLPGIALLNQKQDKADAGDVNGNAQIIHDTFSNFNIEVEMEGANIGPRVTQYTLKPPTGVKLTKITALENNLALDLAAHSIRMEAPIPGKRAVGIEVPNVKAATVRISSLLQSREWQSIQGPLAFGIG
jgi:S-DNA-T family DNA segregation ATPase FtsK/SpoIIIE